MTSGTVASERAFRKIDGRAAEHPGGKRRARTIALPIVFGGSFTENPSFEKRSCARVEMNELAGMPSAWASTCLTGKVTPSISTAHVCIRPGFCRLMPFDHHVARERVPSPIQSEINAIPRSLPHTVHTVSLYLYVNRLTDVQKLARLRRGSPKPRRSNTFSRGLLE